MASLAFNHNAYYAAFSVSGKKIWKRIGKVEKREAKKLSSIKPRDKKKGLSLEPLILSFYVSIICSGKRWIGIT